MAESNTFLHSYQHIMAKCSSSRRAQRGRIQSQEQLCRGRDVSSRLPGDAGMLNWAAPSPCAALGAIKSFLCDCRAFPELGAPGLPLARGPSKLLGSGQGRAANLGQLCAGLSYREIISQTEPLAPERFKRAEFQDAEHVWASSRMFVPLQGRTELPSCAATSRRFQH